MEETPRRGLRDYEQGDTNWDHSDTVQLVEVDTIERGSIADRPDTGTYDDEFYYATDQNILWGWDESASDWIIRGGTGSKDQPLDAVYTEQTYTGEVIVYVDPDGSNENDGLSPSNPKETINAAISDAPIHGNQLTSLEVHLAEGMHTADGGGNYTVDLRSGVPKIRIVGETNSNGEPVSTIDGSGMTSAVGAVHTRVVLEDVAVHGGATTLSCRSSTIECINVHATAEEDTDRLAYAVLGSWMEIDSDCIFDVTNSSDPISNVAATGVSCVRADGTYIGGGSSNGIVGAKENSWVYIRESAVLDGEGTVGHFVQANDQSDAKIGHGAEMKNGGYRTEADFNSNFKYHGDITTENMDARDRVNSLSGARNEFREEAQRGGINDSRPRNFSLSGKHTGLYYYRKDDARYEYWANERSSYMEVGREIVVESVLGVPPGGEDSVVLPDIGKGDQFGVTLGINDADDHCEIRHRVRWNNGDERHNLIIEEVTGTPTDDVGVRFTIWKR